VGTRDVQTQSARAQPLPFSSYREKGERRPSSGTQAGVGDSPRKHRPVSVTALGNTRALFRSTRGKKLGLWPGTWIFVGDRASSPPRFNTYSYGSTHLGAAQPVPGFFLPFNSLAVGTLAWALGLGTWIGRDLGLGTQDSVSKEVKVCD